MDKVDFIAACAESGYCSKKFAKAYVEKSGKETFTEQDFIEVFRQVYGAAHGHGMRGIYAINGKTTKRYPRYNSGSHADC